MKKIFYIDLFSGAGGTTTGIHLADSENIKVVACVNHDANAIASHELNHPQCRHYIEDVRDRGVILKLKYLVRELRAKHDCIIVIWASLECTNYSKAKGGKPRDADSRTLAYSLYNYTEEIAPEYMMIENVREFMSWGPLDENGKPISKYNGKDYIQWFEFIKSMGYNYDHKILNSANYGAYTSRERYFGQFYMKGMPISWPDATHVKKAKEGMFESLEQWKSVKDILDLKDEGNSIFDRKKPLVENTLQRIYAGLVKFVAGGEKEYLYRYNGGNMEEKAKSLLQPIGVIATSNRHAIVKCNFMVKNYSGHPKSKVHDLNQPASTITCIDHNSIVQPQFLTSYYGNTKGAQSIDSPCPTVTTKDRFQQITANFIDMQYGNGSPASIDKPANTITTSPKLALVTVNNRFLMNPQYKSKGSSIEKPCFTLIARMDKAPPYIIKVDEGSYAINIYSNDNPTMIKIKKFMAAYGIVDIKMRMLKISELLQIQGFPVDYKLVGTATEQKKFIGNAVVTHMSKAIASANAEAINNHFPDSKVA